MKTPQCSEDNIKTQILVDDVVQPQDHISTVSPNMAPHQ